MILENRIRKFNIQHLTIEYFFNSQITRNWFLINPFKISGVYNIPLGDKRRLKVDTTLTDRILFLVDIQRIYDTIDNTI